MSGNTHQSPSSPQAGEPRAGLYADNPSWGRLEILWDICFLFGAVWFLGSALMYGALLTIAVWLGSSLSKLPYSVPQPYYDLAGYIAFGSCSATALIAATVLLVKRWAAFVHLWPDWRMSLQYLLWSTVILAPAWVVYIWAAESYGMRLPLEGEWVAIAAGSLLGLVHGYVCRRGWRYHRRKTTPAPAAVTDPSTAVDHAPLIRGYVANSEYLHDAACCSTREPK
jgi:hypothetical protein